MIHALDEADRYIVEALLQHAPEWTIYYQANIETWGFCRAALHILGQLSGSRCAAWPIVLAQAGVSLAGQMPIGRR